MNFSKDSPLSERCSLSGRALLVSIHTRYAEAIMAGRKKVELRRRFDPKAAGSRMLVYATIPTAAVIGHTVIRSVYTMPIDRLWLEFGDQTEVSYDHFHQYFEGRAEGSALLLSSPKRFASPVPLKLLRETYGLAPPQSYLYLREAHRELIQHEQH